MGTAEVAVSRTGAGSDTANIDSGISAHIAYAVPAPNSRRTGRRIAKTSKDAAVTASVLSSNQPSKASRLIVELRDQSFEFRQIFGRNPAVFAEMRDQRRHPAIE